MLRSASHPISAQHTQKAPMSRARSQRNTCRSANSTSTQPHATPPALPFPLSPSSKASSMPIPNCQLRSTRTKTTAVSVLTWSLPRSSTNRSQPLTRRGSTALTKMAAQSSCLSLSSWIHMASHSIQPLTSNTACNGMASTFSIGPPSSIFPTSRAARCRTSGCASTARSVTSSRKDLRGLDVSVQ
jgi:hypothetical protein